jgi:hypothetical protein
MAKITFSPKLDVRVYFAIDEEEARALDALSGYGTDAFIKAFYETLGKAYMQKHEQGLRSFLSSIREIITPALSKVDNARKIL